MAIFNFGHQHFGVINGSSFPNGTDLWWSSDKDSFVIQIPKGVKETITHDMIKCSTVLAACKVYYNGNLVDGFKYLCLFKDGRQGVLSVPCAAAYDLEHIIF